MRGEKVAWWEHLGVVEEMFHVGLDVSHSNDGLDRCLGINRIICLHIEAYSMSDRSWRNHATARHALRPWVSARELLANRCMNGLLTMAKW